MQSTYRGTGSGGDDAFVSKLAPSGSSLVYSTYLGGAGYEVGHAVAVDEAGSAYVAGLAGSPDFPIKDALQPVLKSPDYGDAFLTRLSPTGALVFSTFLGGSGNEVPLGIAVDRAGIVVAGYTSSADFPLAAPVQAECRPFFDRRCNVCFTDAFVTRLSPGGREIVFSTFLGGTVPIRGETGAEDLAQGLALGPGGDIYLTGYTQSLDFPTRNAIQPVFGGGVQIDAWVARIGAANRPPDCAAATASPATLWPPNGKLRPVALRGVTDPDGDLVALAVTSIRQDEPLAKKGSPDATGLGTARPQVRADRQGVGDGRVYRLGFTATDGKGGTCTGEVTVCVPHDQRPGVTCGDGGALFDSTGR
ncbi:MAG TPA: SBBP repeat-containing protein [Thermoanaerobaculia bacterium]|nr:SBBP repeat-containing protein [Thermoanaerobaculia bacterium]